MDVGRVRESSGGMGRKRTKQKKKKSKPFQSRETADKRHKCDMNTAVTKANISVTWHAREMHSNNCFWCGVLR